MTTVAPYGSWPSPISAASLVAQARGLSQVVVDAGAVYWNERRPDEGARQVIVRHDRAGRVEDVLDPPWSARTLVHEYGGQSFALHEGTVYFSQAGDQRLYRLVPGGTPEPITSTLPGPGLRFADPVVSGDGRLLFAVRERHLSEEVLNDLVVLGTNGRNPERVIASGHDFYAAPRLSPDGSRLAFIAWDHPNMPWDATFLYVAPLGPDGSLGEALLVAGGADESVSQPRFHPSGTLWYLSDRSGYWALYDETGMARSPLEHDFGLPDWVFGQASYTFLEDGRCVAVRCADCLQQLGLVGPDSFTPIAPQYTVVGDVHALDGGLVALAGSASRPLALVAIDPANGRVATLRTSREGLDEATVSLPRPIAFPAEGGQAYGLYYPPSNPDFVAPQGQRPPLIVQSHGGPTAAASALFDLGIQFFTSRGIGVVAVNYGGSSGNGRAYRKRLEGRWGIVDVADCVAAAKALVASGDVDGERLIIRGGSAGGFTALAALVSSDVFALGSSHFGVSDLVALASDTHKFESRYLDGLIGPYPREAERYEERSPVLHADRIHRPAIFFQGLDDPIVPPNQAEVMVEALRSRGIPVAYLTFPGEQHGFRKAESIIRVAEAELYFFGAVLGFTPADDLEPVPIDNAGALRR